MKRYTITLTTRMNDSERIQAKSYDSLEIARADFERLVEANHYHLCLLDEEWGIDGDMNDENTESNVLEAMTPYEDNASVIMSKTEYIQDGLSPEITYAGYTLMMIGEEEDWGIVLIGDEVCKTLKEWEDCTEDEVIYVPDAAVEDLNIAGKNIFQSDIRRNVPDCTKREMKSLVRSYMRDYPAGEEKVDEIARNIFNSVEWECFETKCEELDYDGEFGEEA